MRHFKSFAFLIKSSFLLSLFIHFSFSHFVNAQLPVCDKIYLDQLKVENLGLSITSTGKIYSYDPAAAVSATNPSLNTITLPSNAGGLTVSEVLGSGNSTLTFYTVVSGNYWYYNPTTSSWTNTGHGTGNSAAVNIASGGGYIYNLVGSTGQIYKYDGTQTGTLLTTISDFPDAGPYDIIADCAGNFYVLRFSPQTVQTNTRWLRKYSPTGALLQSWVVTNPNGWFASGGFGIIGQTIYIDDVGNNTYARIASADISGTTINVTTQTSNLPPYNATGSLFNQVMYMIGDMGSCASSIPILPEITIAGDSVLCNSNPITFTSTIANGGNNPLYQWYLNGQPIAGATNSSYVHNNPQNGDVISCQFTSSESCVDDPIAVSNSITILVSPGGVPLFDPVGPYCTGAQIPALPTTSNNNIPGSWSPPINNTTTTTYTFTPDLAQCSQSTTMTIVVNESLQSSFDTFVCKLPIIWNGIYVNQAGSQVASDTFQTSTGCDSVVFLNLSLASSPTIINKDSIVCDSLILNGKVYYNDTVVTTIFQSKAGCDSVIRNTNYQIIHFKLNLTANFQTISKGDMLELTTSGNNSYTVFSWSPTDYFPNQGANFQTFYPQESNTFRVKARSQGVCIDSASVFVEVLDPNTEVFWPNAFTPNNDGLNDYFGPIFSNPSAVTEIEFSIYNRLGQLVYISFKATDKGWDGTFKNKPCESGVYYYFINYKLKNGTKEFFKGDCQLIR